MKHLSSWQDRLADATSAHDVAEEAVRAATEGLAATVREAAALAEADALAPLLRVAAELEENADEIAAVEATLSMLQGEHAALQLRLVEARAASEEVRAEFDPVVRARLAAESRQRSERALWHAQHPSAVVDSSDPLLLREIERIREAREVRAREERAELEVRAAESWRAAGLAD